MVFLAGCASSGPQPGASRALAAASDRYRSFAELAAEQKEGQDFRVVVEPRESPLTVLAIHAGWIERGSGELAREIARRTGGSLYLFEGLTGTDHSTLHITSARFDEPRALELAARSGSCVSVHGHAGSELAACIGGLDRRLADRVAEALSAALVPELRVIRPCGKFPAEDPKNIVNRCQKAGVQLELSRGLRDRLLEDPALLGRVAEAISKAVSSAPGT
jgi:phage replication-related protein YjqB (UPF0714/DUF867 family)